MGGDGAENTAPNLDRLTKIMIMFWCKKKKKWAEGKGGKGAGKNSLKILTGSW